MKILKSLPVPLQKQVLLRLCLSLLLFVFGLLCTIAWRDKSMLIIIAVAVFFALLGVRIMLREHIVITGTCVEADATMIRKRTKAIVLIAELNDVEVKLRIPLRQQFKKIVVGDKLEFYVDATTQIYEWDGEFRLHSYIAVDKRPE